MVASVWKPFVVTAMSQPVQGIAVNNMNMTQHFLTTFKSQLLLVADEAPLDGVDTPSGPWRSLGNDHGRQFGASGRDRQPQRVSARVATSLPHVNRFLA